MNSRTSTISDRMQNGLLAAVFVVSNLFHIAPCCCASLDCGGSLDAGLCCAVEASQGCCCCKPSSDDELANFTCCCSKTSQQSSTGCPGACHCSASPLTEGIIAAPQRIQQKQDQKTWLTDFHSNPLQPISNAIVSADPGPEQQYPGNPCAHNLRQSILCVWRN